MSDTLQGPVDDDDDGARAPGTLDEAIAAVEEVFVRSEVQGPAVKRLPASIGPRAVPLVEDPDVRTRLEAIVGQMRFFMILGTLHLEIEADGALVTIKAGFQGPATQAFLLAAEKPEEEAPRLSW